MVLFHLQCWKTSDKDTFIPSSGWYSPHFLCACSFILQSSSAKTQTDSVIGAHLRNNRSQIIKCHKNESRRNLNCHSKKNIDKFFRKSTNKVCIKITANFTKSHNFAIKIISSSSSSSIANVCNAVTVMQAISRNLQHSTTVVLWWEMTAHHLTALPY